MIIRTPELTGTWSATSESDWVGCRLEPIPVRGSVASDRIIVNVRPEVPSGEWHSSIRLASSGADATTLSIPVTIRVEP